MGVSKLQTEISLSTLHSEYGVLSYSVRYSLPMKSIIKEIIDNLMIDSEKLNFVSISTINDNNNVAKLVATSQRMNPKSKLIVVKYYLFSHHVRKYFVIQNIESETRRHIFLPKVYKVNFLAVFVS